MPASAAEWLAQNSIDCQPLVARISKDQCKANQGHIYACENCPNGGVKYVGPQKVARKARGKQEPTIVLPIIKQEESAMTTKKITPRGFCPSCKRDNVIMNGTKCPRCYYRISKGQDPITGKPAAVQEAAPSPKAPTPPISKKTAAQPKPAANACTVDVVQLLDDTWISQRMMIIGKLNNTRSNYSRLELALGFVDRLKELGA